MRKTAVLFLSSAMLLFLVSCGKAPGEAAARNTSDDIETDSAALISIENTEPIDFNNTPENAAAGNGTKESPYIITTAQQLFDIRRHLKGYFVLGRDIDLQNEGFEPIGSGAYESYEWDTEIGFQGVLDGNGYAITGLNILSTSEFSGLFASIGKDGVVKNLNISGRARTQDDEIEDIIGLIAGYNCGLIENCSVTADIDGVGDSKYVGGLLGVNEGAIVYCFSKGSIKGEGRAVVGGITGYNDVSGRIIACTNEAYIESGLTVGEIAGENSYENYFRESLTDNRDLFERDIKINWEDGYGIVTYANGDVYSGEFKNGKRSGQGKFNYINGDSYHGEYKDNERHGEGVYIWETKSDVVVYRGEFKNDCMDGKGALQYGNEKVIEGTFHVIPTEPYGTFFLNDVFSSFSMPKSTYAYPEALIADVYKVYYGALKNALNEFGTGVSLRDYEKGVNYAQLIDFDDDSLAELLYIYNDGQNPHIVVYGYSDDTKKTELIFEDMFYYAIEINIDESINGGKYLYVSAGGSSIRTSLYYGFTDGQFGAALELDGYRSDTDAWGLSGGETPWVYFINGNFASSDMFHDAPRVELGIIPDGGYVLEDNPESVSDTLAVLAGYMR